MPPISPCSQNQPPTPTSLLPWYWLLSPSGHFSTCFLFIVHKSTSTAFSIPLRCWWCPTFLHLFLDLALPPAHRRYAPCKLVLCFHNPFLHFRLLEWQRFWTQLHGMLALVGLCEAFRSLAHSLGDLDKLLTSMNPSCLLLKIKIKPIPYLSGLFWGLNEMRNVNLFWCSRCSSSRCKW